MKELERFIKALNDSKSITDLNALLIEFVGELGFFMSTYAIMSAREMSPEDRLGLMLGYAPPNWIDHYLLNGFLNYDHGVLQAYKRGVAYDSKQLKKEINFTPAESRVFDDAEKFGLKFNIVAPIHGPDGEVAFLSVGSNSDDPQEHERLRGYRHIIQLAAIHLHERIRDLGLMKKIGEDIKLSDRERDCILWAARGKTAWESGQILGISENTVNTHVKSAMAKLGVANRQEAIAKSIAYRFIDPYDPGNVGDTTSPLMSYRETPT